MASKKKNNTTLLQDLVMVKLHVEFDTGYRTSKEMSDIIAEEKGTNRNALRAGVLVLSKTLTSPFTGAVSRLRTHYLENSLPWDKGNWRIVPVTAWVAFKQQLETLIAEVKDEFDKCYVQGYQALKADYTSMIGSLDVDFPLLDDLKSRFNVEYKMGQTASCDDIRIQGIDQMERDRIRQDMQEQYEEKINDGLTELARKLVTAAEDIGQRVTDPDQKSKKYTRSIENLKELADTAEKLNITGNEAIQEACKCIREDIAQWSPEAIKTTPMVREHVAGAAGTIADKLSGLRI